jgi:uncharacterized protein (TIGR03437 family)
VLSTPARQFAKVGARLIFTTGVADPSGLPVQVAAEGLPNGASFDPATNEFTWIPRGSQQGQYQVMFTATNTAHQRSTTQVLMDVDSGKPELTDSQQVACSPNAIASVTGKWLSTMDGAASEPSGRALRLGGTQVRINGEAAPILSSSPTRVSFLCPNLSPGTPFSLVIDTDAGSTEPLSSTVQEVSPRILPVEDSGQQGLIVFPETGDVAVARNAKVPGHPAQPGDRLVVWGTGLGLAEQIMAGTVQVRVGTVYANVDGVVSADGFAGLSGVEFRVPRALNFGDAVPVELHVLPPSGHPADSNEVTASIEPVRP